MLGWVDSLEEQENGSKLFICRAELPLPRGKRAALLMTHKKLPSVSGLENKGSKELPR